MITSSRLRARARLFGLVVIILSLTGYPTAQAADPVQLTPPPAPTGPARQLPSPVARPLLTSGPTPTPTLTFGATPSLSPRVAVSASPGPSPSPSLTPGPKLVTRPPSIRAESAIVVDADTGRILFAKNPNQPRPMASTTKIMTALTMFNLYPAAGQLQAETTVSEEDLVGEANMGLRKDERIRLSTLLLGLMTNSANEAGMALARYAGQRLAGPAEPVDRFVAAMNAYALSLGMFDTHYMNPHGLDQPGHYSSAYDLAISGWYALRNPQLMQYAQYRGGLVQGHDIYNVNSFLGRYPGATGIKPGLTDEAGRCLVASARNYGRNVLVVVLDSPDPAREVDPLMDYAFTLLDGRAEIPLSAINLGSLSLPRPGTAPKTGLPAITSKALQAAVRLQFEYTLRLAVAMVLGGGR